MTAQRDPWLVSLTPAVTRPAGRILCLPFAGAGAAAYRTWGGLAPEGVEILAVRLPGRETRIGEAPAADVAAMVAGIHGALKALAPAPLALFGHSMGAVIAHDLALALDDAGTPPAAVMVSGRRAPFLPPRRPRPMFDLPEPDFLKALRAMGGTPEAVFAHRELLDLVLPVLRADFRVAETFHRPRRPVFDFPVIAVAGATDAQATPAEIDAWGELCAGRFAFHVFPGGHFFLHDVAADLVSLLAREAGLR